MVVGGGTQPSQEIEGIGGESAREGEKPTEGKEDETQRVGEKRPKGWRVQLRVERRSVCQSFVWTSRSTRLIVPTGIGIGIYAYTFLAASIIVDSHQCRSRVNFYRR